MPAASNASFPLGHLMVTHGRSSAAERFERLASKAFLTRKISVLLPVQGLQGPQQAQLPSRLQLQRHMFLLEDVALESLGDPAFVKDVEKLGIAGLSRSQRGLDSGNVLALLPVGGGRLVSALQLPSFQRLGLEEPMPGTSQLEQKYLPSGQRHVHVDLPISKTRAKRAAKQGEVATSRWQALVQPLQETISLVAYCNKETGAPYDFLPLQSFGGTISQMEVPIRSRVVSLGDQPASRPSASCLRPPIEQLICEPSSWPHANGRGGGKHEGLSDAFGSACEDFLDWLGALQL
ncbi:Hypothetical protein (Fragment), partial [Durusdinium trenchii]